MHLGIVELKRWTMQMVEVESGDGKRVGNGRFHMSRGPAGGWIVIR